MTPIVWIFDNDNTLYLVPKKLEETITTRGILQLMNTLNLSRLKLEKKRSELKAKHQTETTVAAFMLEGLIPDFKTFVAQTYLAIDPADFGLREDLRLQEILSQLPGPKYILTNNPRDFALLICRLLGILRFFEQIFGIEDMNFIGKPAVQTFQKLIPLLPSHESRILIDDQEAALDSAKKAGFITVKVGIIQKGNYDLIIPQIYELTWEKVEVVIVMRQKIAKILRWLEKQGINCTDEKIGFGHVCQTIFRGKKGNQALVVKIGLTKEAKEEVLRNKIGYDKMKELGAADYIPNPCEIVEFEGIPILILADCGEDLLRTLQKTDNPEKIFEKIVRELRNLYRNTRRKDPDQEIRKSLLDVFAVLQEQFRDYLSVYEPFSTIQPILQKVQEKILQIHSSSGCFACWDFTPEDMFLTPEGLKIIDPKENVFDLPIVGLACFAGVSRDVYKLPGAENGYQLIKQLASKTGKSLGLKSQDVDFLFNLGRALQSSLSSRHRLGKDEMRSKKFFVMSKEFLKKCLT